MDRGWQPKEGSWTSRLIGTTRLSHEEKDYKTIKEREILKKHGE